MQSTCTGTAHKFSGKFTQDTFQVKLSWHLPENLRLGTLHQKILKKIIKKVCVYNFLIYLHTLNTYNYDTKNQSTNEIQCR